jgi:hypothetical protein
MSELKHGIFIHEITDKHVWLVYYHKGKAIYKQPMAQTFRDFLSVEYQQDIDSGEVAKGFRPEFAFAALRLGDAIDKELKKA